MYPSLLAILTTFPVRALLREKLSSANLVMRTLSPTCNCGGLISVSSSIKYFWFVLAGLEGEYKGVDCSFEAFATEVIRADIARELKGRLCPIDPCCLALETIEELVAELGAAFLCADLEITPGGGESVREDHASYIASWLKVFKDDKRAIFSAARHAQRAADYLHELQAPCPGAAPALPGEPAPERS